MSNSRRKSVRDVACLTAEGRLFQRTAPPQAKLLFFVIVSTWQGNSKVIIRIAEIVRSNHISPLE